MAMIKKIVLFLIAVELLSSFYSGSYCAANQKIGVLVMGSGMNETYKPDWIMGYMGHFFPIFTPGQLAGGDLEGGSCLSLIHYANPEEAAVCSQVRSKQIQQGTAIDIFCNEYQNTGHYPVHSIFNHPLFGKNGFFANCYAGLLPYFIESGHSTIDPKNGEEIIGPHVDDPDGPGIGIADFDEQYAFTYMQYHYTLTDFRDPSRRQYLRFMYGNDVPQLYEYTPDAIELSNVKAEVEKALDNGTSLVFRTCWESYLFNKDAYGRPASIPDSAETALHELIVDEKVDRIVVLGNGAHYSNITNFGYCWRDAGGKGISRLDNATYCDCINNLDDGYGPATQKDLTTLLENKPWRKFNAPYAVITHMAKDLNPVMQITFARSYGDYPAFNDAVVEMLKHAVAKYGIDSKKKLKVILALHGYSNGYMNGAQCDSYFNNARDLAGRVADKVKQYLAGAWSGTYEVAQSANEYAEPFDEDVSSDKPTKEKPMGDIMSTGEHIDIAINGTYVNELGQAIDNGTNNFDYVIVIPILWDVENVDTIKSFREYSLGNHALQSAQGSKIWMRQMYSEDGDPYHSGADYDEEFFTVKVMDASGWESTPARTALFARPQPVKKGSTSKPTTVILTGTMLSQGNGPVRSYIVQAAAESILEAINDPTVGGYLDEACELRALNTVTELHAVPLNGSVKLNWKIMSEVENTRFNIYRAESEDGAYEKINSAIVSAKGSSTKGTSYEFVDKEVKSRKTYWYKLEEIYPNGKSTMHGPVSAMPRLILGIFEK